MITTTIIRFGHTPYVLQDGPHRLLDTGSDFTEPFVINPIIVGTPMILGACDEPIERTLLPESASEPAQVGALDSAE